MGNYTHYTDNAICYEMPDFVIDKKDNQVFCTVQGYSRLTNLTHELIYKRLRDYRGSGAKEVVYDDIDEIVIIPLSTITKWTLKDNPLIARKIMHHGSTVSKRRFISLIQRKKELDETRDITSIQEATLPRYIDELKAMLNALEHMRYVALKSDGNAGYQSVLLDMLEKDELTETLCNYFTWGPENIEDSIKKLELSIKFRESQLIKLGTVYLVGSRKARFLKIGYTTNVERRLKELQSEAASYELEIIKTKRGTYETEQVELLKAKSFRIKGEMFAWDDSIIENF